MWGGEFCCVVGVVLMVVVLLFGSSMHRHLLAKNDGLVLVLRPMGYGFAFLT